MNDFFDDYLNEIHDEHIAKNLRELKKEYYNKKDDIISSAGPKLDKAKAWKKLTDEVSPPNTAQELKNLENAYKQKAADAAEPGIEDKNKFKELAKKHAPDLQNEQSDPVITASQEADLKQIADHKAIAREKFKAQFKINAKDIQEERD